MSSPEEPELRIVARGGAALPSAHQIVYRLRGGAWHLAPPAPDGEVDDLRLEALRRLDSVASWLDTQGPVAPDWVARLSRDEVGEHFERLISDRAVLLEHRADADADADARHRCRVDAEPLPCAALRATAATYLTPATEADVEADDG